jgi:uncharacterized membrane protein (Fun14 family)
MAMVPRRSGALVRRVVTWGLGIDAVVALFVGLAISHVLGWILFVIGLIVTAFTSLNLSQVLRVRGRR